MLEHSFLITNSNSKFANGELHSRFNNLWGFRLPASAPTQFANFLIFPHRGSDHFLILVGKHRNHSDLTAATSWSFGASLSKSVNMNLSALTADSFFDIRGILNICCHDRVFALMYYVCLQTSAIEVEFHSGIHLHLSGASYQLIFPNGQDEETMIIIIFYVLHQAT